MSWKADGLRLAAVRAGELGDVHHEFVDAFVDFPAPLAHFGHFAVVPDGRPIVLLQPLAALLEHTCLARLDALHDGEGVVATLDAGHTTQWSAAARGLSR